MTCSGKHLEHLLLCSHSLRSSYFTTKSVTVCTNFILCLVWITIKILISFISTAYRLHWGHITSRFSLQHHLNGCKENIKLTSKPSAHQCFPFFTLFCIEKLSSCLSVHMDVCDLKHLRIHDIPSAAKKFPCTSPSYTLSFSATEKLCILGELDHGI